MSMTADTAELVVAVAELAVKVELVLTVASEALAVGPSN